MFKANEEELKQAAQKAWEWAYDQFCEHYADEWFTQSMKAQLPEEDWEKVTSEEWDRLNEMVRES